MKLLRFGLLFYVVLAGMKTKVQAQQQAGKKSTANDRVRVVDTAFYMPQLKRHRRIWIYLPPGYAASRKKYPVLYLQDGQNVFDEATAFSGEWGVDEAMDTLSKTVGPAIVVAVDNGGERRLSEYSPFDFTVNGEDGKPVLIKGEGSRYTDFLVHTLQPFIKKHYRAKKWGKHHYIAGSSLGGLISFYALLKHPRKWGGAGVFSPAFWIDQEALLKATTRKGKKVKGKIYFYAGKKESERMVPDMLAVFAQLNKSSKARMTTVIRTEGKHNEAAWRAEFPRFYKWLFASEP